MKPILAFGKGIVVAALALPALPFIVIHSYLDIETVSQLISRFLM
jgi:hypothetical protein